MKTKPVKASNGPTIKPSDMPLIRELVQCAIELFNDLLTAAERQHRPIAWVIERHRNDAVNVLERLKGKQ